MFRPTQLVVSVQGSFLKVDIVDGKDQEAVKHVPSNLLGEVRHGTMPLRTYDVITAFTIEPWRPDFGDDSPNKGVEEPIRGCMTTYGFALPYPKGNRFSIWFTGGCIEVDNTESDKWFKIFGQAPSRSLFESSRFFAARLLVGAAADDTMDENGRLSYELTRPKAGHIDLLYLDESMQILRGSSGTLYVHVRVATGMLLCDSSKSEYLSATEPVEDESEVKGLPVRPSNPAPLPCDTSFPPPTGAVRPAVVRPTPLRPAMAASFARSSPNIARPTPVRPSAAKSSVDGPKIARPAPVRRPPQGRAAAA